MAKTDPSRSTVSMDVLGERNRHPFGRHVEQ